MKVKWIVVSVLVVCACICLISMVATGSPLPVEAFRSGSAAIRLVVAALLGLLVFLVAVLLVATLREGPPEKPEAPAMSHRKPETPAMSDEEEGDETSGSAGSAAKQKDASHAAGVPSGPSTDAVGVGSEATDRETSEPSGVSPVSKPRDTTEPTGATPERSDQQFGMAPEAKGEETSKSAGIAAKQKDVSHAAGAPSEPATDAVGVGPEATDRETSEPSAIGSVSKPRDTTEPTGATPERSDQQFGMAPEAEGDETSRSAGVTPRATSEEEGGSSSQAEEEAGSLVHFSAFAPRVVRPGIGFVLDIWAYVEEQRAEMLERAERRGKAVEAGSKGPVRVPRDTDILVLLHLPGFEVENDRDTLVWACEVANVSFVVRALASLRPGDYVGTARLIQCGREAARLSFTLRVGDEEAPAAELPGELRAVRSAFASYESSDRLRVLDVVRGMRAAGVDVFLDVLSLRTQDNWQERIPREIRSRDRFCLFWSGAASRSKWVGWEWRCALETIGCERIEPMPLVDPSDVHPPAELRECAQFDDVARMAYDYYARRQRDSGH